ncbi:MAG: UDP-2,3-diacylglucosamine diphosphatase [Ignavibacteria bacterium]
MENKKYYFFSDAHLGLKSKEEEKAKEERVIKFLRTIAPDALEIYIVGDLFDCWIEYRKVVPKGYFKLLAALNEIAESGLKINFLSGNHDFWLNTYLRDEVGLNIFYNPIVREIDGKKLFIVHGDGLSKGDYGYKIIKRILRSRFNQFLYSLIHPDIGVALAQSSSRKSRDSRMEDLHLGFDGMKEFAETKITEGYDYIIMGHVHKPQMMEINKNGKKGYFITLGDWIKNFSYGVFSQGCFELKYWR